MIDVQNHYDDHLGPIYEWMAGPFDAGCVASSQLFEELGLSPAVSRMAVDLGSGHGFQAIPLAQRGYQVIAIDTCAELLQSLADRKGELSIQTVQADITDCWDDLPADLDVVVCMGDTLTHLGCPDEVADLIRRVAAALSQGGTFVTTFRDYVSAPLQGDQRFIPVRSDANRILTCFLEMLEMNDRHVRVHDIVHERSGSTWNLKVSSYDKLRLEPGWVGKVIQDFGLEIVIDRAARGMVTIAARSRESK